LGVIVIYGASFGAMMSLRDCADVGRRSGMHITIVSLGVLASLRISGAIKHPMGHRVFLLALSCAGWTESKRMVAFGYPYR